MVIEPTRRFGQAARAPAQPRAPRRRAASCTPRRRARHATPHAPIDPNVMLLDCIFTLQPLRCWIDFDTAPYLQNSVRQTHSTFIYTINRFMSILLDIVLQTYVTFNDIWKRLARHNSNASMV